MDTDTQTLTEVWFSGRVQGVGFRFETNKIAKGYEVTGFVENLKDGRVHLLAQGTHSEVQEFIEAISDSLSDYIREQEQRKGSPSVLYKSFEIRR